MKEIVGTRPGPRLDERGDSGVIRAAPELLERFRIWRCMADIRKLAPKLSCTSNASKSVDHVNQCLL